MQIERKIVILVLSLLLLSSCALRIILRIESKQTLPSSKTFYTEYVTEQKKGNVVETKTTQTLFEFPADIKKAKSPCCEIIKNGLTGHWDDSEFSLIRECDYKKDRCFAIFEKDKTKYYGVVLVSSSAPDFPSKMIIVPQNVYDELSQ